MGGMRFRWIKFGGIMADGNRGSGIFRSASPADRFAGLEVRYLVIDAGWYGWWKTDGTEWGVFQSDWNPTPGLFPKDLEAIAREIRQCGLLRLAGA